jgi:hypothetical protein
MALVEEAIVSLLSGVAGGRSYGYRLPRNVTLPALTYMKVSGPRDQTQEGPSGLVAARVQVSSWGATYGAAKTLSNAVRLALDGYRGTTLDVRIDGIQLLNESDQNEPEPDTYQVIMDFRVMYAEERP